MKHAKSQMTGVSTTSRRACVSGRFVFEGVSFGYAYWELEDATAPQPVIPNGATLSFVAPDKVSLPSVISGEAKPATPVILSEAKPSIPVILSEAKRSRKIFPSKAESECASSNLSAVSSLSALPGYGGTRPLVLVHGFAQSAKSWEPVVAGLVPERPVWAFELMGHGSSDCPTDREAYDLDLQGRALLAFLEAVVQGDTPLPPAALESPWNPSTTLDTTSRKFALVGYSMGGRVVLSAMAYTQRFAQVVSDVVLESAGLGASSPEVRTEAARKDAFHAAKLREEGLEAFFDYWEALPLFASQKQLSHAVQQAIRAERLAHNPQALAATFERAGQHCMPLRQEIYQRLQALRSCGVNLTYLVGEKDSKYLTLAHEASQAIELPITIVPDCGHNVHAELMLGCPPKLD